MEYDVFISYSSEDGDVAQKVHAYLQQKGLKPWIAPQCIPAGEPYARAIINGISKCRLMVVILSKTSNSSDDVLNEVDQAHREKKVILPFVIDETEMSGEMRYYLSRKQWINAFPEVTTVHCEKLFKAIGTYLPSNSGEKPQDGGIPNEPQETPQEIKPEPEVKNEPKRRESDVVQNMMETFLEMELVPTRLYDWRKPKKSRVLSVIFFVISLVPLFFFVTFFLNRLTITWEGADKSEIEIVRRDIIENSIADSCFFLSGLKYREYASGIGMVDTYINLSEEDIPDSYKTAWTKEMIQWNVQEAIDMQKQWRLSRCKKQCGKYCIKCINLALPFLFLGYLFLVPYPKKNSPKLSSLSDYIQKYRYKRKTRFGKKPQFVFFVKDCLFGVMDVADYKVQIPAEYERIGWKVKDSIIRVTKGGHDFTIDINGERLQ